MNRKDIMEALAIIVEEQKIETGSVEIRIGRRSERNERSELYLITCCSKVIDALTDAGFYVEATRFDGVRVFKTNDGF